MGGESTEFSKGKWCFRAFGGVRERRDKGDPADDGFAFPKAFYRVFHQKEKNKKYLEEAKLPWNKREGPHVNK